jgi:hypothetical protein
MSRNGETAAVYITYSVTVKNPSSLVVSNDRIVVFQVGGGRSVTRPYKNKEADKIFWKVTNL